MDAWQPCEFMGNDTRAEYACVPNTLYAADPVAAVESAELQRCDGTSTEHWFGVDDCSIWMLAWWSRLSVQVEGYTAGQGGAREVK